MHLVVYEARAAPPQLPGFRQFGFTTNRLAAFAGEKVMARRLKRWDLPAMNAGGLEGGLMPRLLALVVIAGLGAVASASAEDAAAHGEKVFAAQKCSLCHSIGGKGNPKGPLDEAVAKLSAAEIRAWITDAKGMTAKTNAARKPAMKEFTLPKEDVDGLVAYLMATKAK
jgi:mono/diheme cytochrome c family protein